MNTIKYFTKNSNWFSLEDITRDLVIKSITINLWFEYLDTNIKKKWTVSITYDEKQKLYLYEVKWKSLLKGQTNLLVELRSLIKRDLLFLSFQEKEDITINTSIQDTQNQDIFDNIKKTIYLMIWLPGSGKSTYIQNLNLWKDSIVLGLDLVRKDLYGQEIIQGDGTKVYGELQRRIKDALQNKTIKTIYIDNTNLYRKMRKDFLVYKSENVDVKAINFIVPFHIAFKRNLQRVWKTVPENVMFRMINLYQEPTLEEGFSEIKTIYDRIQLQEDFIVALKKYIMWDLSQLSQIVKSHELFSQMKWFQQTSQYHQEDLLQHLEMIWSQIVNWKHSFEDQEKLLLLNIFHDTGKLTTREKKWERLIREREYLQVDKSLFLNKQWQQVIVENYDDYQFIWHENVSKNIFIREFENELLENNILKVEDRQLIRDIIEHHLLFHKSEKLVVEPLKSLWEETKRLWKLFSKYDSLGRVAITKNEEY